MMAGAVVLLAGCTSMAELPEGSTYAQVQQQYGQPTVACDNAPYTLRVWSQQPMGYYAWRGVFDDQDQLLEIQEMMSDTMLFQVGQGIGVDSGNVHMHRG